MSGVESVEREDLHDSEVGVAEGGKQRNFSSGALI
jgi:hypothetical protein